MQKIFAYIVNYAYLCIVVENKASTKFNYL